MHVASIEIDQWSLRRGGTTRKAVCICGWRGPERGTVELAADDALLHEKSEFAVQRKTEGAPMKRPATDPKRLEFWRELHEGYTRTGGGYEVICRQFKEALDEIDRLNVLLQETETAQ